MSNQNRIKLSGTSMNTPIGTLVLIASSHGLCHLDFGDIEDSLPQLEKWADRWFHTVEWEWMDKGNPVLEKASNQLYQYFDQKRTDFEIPLDIYGTDFQKRVWRALTQIPYGQTVSYKNIGERIGAPQAVRAIGGANHNNPLSIIIPCHRVIGHKGGLTGYGGGLEIKSYLLHLESQVIL